MIYIMQCWRHFGKSSISKMARDLLWNFM